VPHRRGSRDGTADQPPHFDRQLVRGVVFDANVFGSDAGFDLRHFQIWARDLHAIGMAVWLPEPLLWELASHVADAFESVSGKVKTIRRAGLAPPVLHDYGGREDIIDRIVDLANGIVEGLEVIQCTDEDAIEAIRDQITRRFPGRVRSGVRTGASDSAWLRSLRRYSGWRNETYLVVSEDSDIKKAYRGWKETPPAIFSNPVTLREHLFLFGLAPDEVVLVCLRSIDQLIASGELMDRLGLESVDDVRTIIQKLMATERDLDIAEMSADIASITGIAGVERVRASESEEAVLLWLDLTMDLRLSLLVWDSSSEKPVPQSRLLENAIVRVPLLMKLAEGGVSSRRFRRESNECSSCPAAWAPERNERRW
jgi:hypothetical protein